MVDRTIVCNTPTLDGAIPSLQQIIVKLNPHIYTPPMHHPSAADAEAHILAIDDAIDLCVRLLRLDATKRLTAAGALRHPFLRPLGGESMADVLEVEQIGVTEGKCGYLHDIEGEKRKLSTSINATAERRQDRASFGVDIEDMGFGQGVPPSRHASKYFARTGGLAHGANVRQCAQSTSNGKTVRGTIRFTPACISVDRMRGASPPTGAVCWRNEHIAEFD
jgi:hypothetical protein